MRSEISSLFDEKNIALDINCYCFNPTCSSSILNAKKFLPVKMPLSRVLTKEVCCETCGEALVSKPLLEIKSLLFGSNAIKETVNIVWSESV